MLKTKSYCNDSNVGRLIEDAKSDLLFAPDRATDQKASSLIWTNAKRAAKQCSNTQTTP